MRTTNLVLIWLVVALVAFSAMAREQFELDRLQSQAIIDLHRRVIQLELNVRALQQQTARLDSVVAWADHAGTTPAYASIVIDAANDVGLELRLAFSLVRVESGFDSLAVSRVGARGLTQIMPLTRDDECPGVDLFDPRANARCGFAYLLKLLDRTDGDLRRALLMYNRGPTRVAYLERIGRDPSNGYARAVCGGSCD